MRHGYRYQGKSAWSAAHQRYLRELVLPHPAMKVILEEYLISIEAAGERIVRAIEGGSGGPESNDYRRRGQSRGYGDDSGFRFLPFQGGVVFGGQGISRRSFLRRAYRFFVKARLPAPPVNSPGTGHARLPL